MLRELQTAGRLTLATVLICAVAYPLAVLGLSALIAPEKRLGSLVYDAEGTVVGAELVAQRFTSDAYLWPRPSACDYDAAAAGGSNLSPTSSLIRERAEAILTKLKLPGEKPVPPDLVTASGSGLDPHISLEAAAVQVSRIAKARGVGENEVRKLIARDATQSAGGLLGDQPLVNVLEANLALDAGFPLATSTASPGHE